MWGEGMHSLHSVDMNKECDEVMSCLTQCKNPIGISWLKVTPLFTKERLFSLTNVRVSSLACLISFEFAPNYYKHCMRRQIKEKQAASGIQNESAGMWGREAAEGLGSSRR